MTSDTAWIDEARRMRSEGQPVRAIVAAFGRSEYFIRRVLNINGLGDRLESANAEKRTGHSTKYVVSAKRSRAGQSEKTYIDPPAPKAISLPRMSILAGPVEGGGQQIRFAPKTRFRAEAPGVARIREIHRRMIRSGKIPSVGLSMEAGR